MKLKFNSSLTAKMLAGTALTLFVGGFGALPVQAVTINPTSYNMRNGQSFYLDDSYTGTITGVDLSGGLGDLTDGVIPTQEWFEVEDRVPGGTGPYVGWVSVDPTITFNFGSVVNIDSLKIYVADSNGLAGVRVPKSVKIGSSNPISLADPAGSGPTSYTFSNLGFTGSSLDLTLNSQDDVSWVFLSEVEFDGTPVPEPLTILGTATALGFGALLKKKKLSQAK